MLTIPLKHAYDSENCGIGQAVMYSNLQVDTLAVTENVLLCTLPQMDNTKTGWDCVARLQISYQNYVKSATIHGYTY